MISGKSVRVLPSALVALILVSTTRAGTIDFGFYPKSAQGCMYTAADTSRCESGTVSATNACLCRNGGNFVTSTAGCLGKSSPGDVETVYTTMEDACRNSNTPLSVSKQDFMSAASAATSTSPPTPSQSADSSTSAEQKDQGGKSLSTGALAGMIVGATAGLAVLGGVIFLLWKKRSRPGEESHPMLPYQQPTQPGHMSLLPTLGDRSTSYSSPPGTGVWPPKEQLNWMSPPNPAHNRASGFNWESPHQLVYNPDADVLDKEHSTYQPYEPVAASPPGFTVAELDSTNIQPPTIHEAPAEMAGSMPITSPGRSPGLPSDTRTSGQHYTGSGWVQQ
ncbi:hypothetical protein QBC43DRAFT_39646 [Cladorrhinum sp. PSN259]|nr:hypothetical protein QBC43DRAFT_39646 [Cladorrhinum sp. PSN259]